MRPHIILLLIGAIAFLPSASALGLDILDVSVRVDQNGLSVATDGRHDAAPPAARTQTVQSQPAAVQPMTVGQGSAQAAPGAWSAFTANPWLLVVVLLGAMLFIGVIWSGFAQREKPVAEAR